MKRFKRLRKKLEVHLTRLALRVVPRLPRSCALALARFLGAAAYPLSPGLRRLGRANLDLAFGDSLSPAGKRNVLRRSFRTFAQVVVDVFWFAHDTRRRITQHIAFDDVIDALTESRPRICVTGHLGNWEILGHAATLHGFPLLSVAAPLSNPAVFEIFQRARQASGQQVVPRQGAVRPLLAALRANSNVGLLLDQNTPPSEGGIFAEFFGLPVPVSPVAASLALRTGAEVVFGFCVPQSNGTYRVRIPCRFTPEAVEGESTKQAIERLTRRILKVIEEEIRRDPGNWLWMYKRWKYVAPGVPRARYPYYAKPPARTVFVQQSVALPEGAQPPR